MNKLKSPIPNEDKIEELLAKIQPFPSAGFHQKMERATWRGKEERTIKSLRLKVAFVITALVIVSTVFVSPQGRAWAQEVFQFFEAINSHTVDVPESLVQLQEDVGNDQVVLPLVPVYIPTIAPAMAAIPGCETPQQSQSYHCNVALAESKLGFDLKEFKELPIEWNFDFVYYNSSSKSATIGYSLTHASFDYGALSLMQGWGDTPEFYASNPWDAVPVDKIQTVKIGNNNGQYVEGGMDSSSESSSLTWNDLKPHRRLGWSDGTRWYLIDLWTITKISSTLTREQLIELAESLVDAPQAANEPLNPNYLYSVSDAEKLSGFDLKAPTLLPMEIDFSYARYYADSKEVRLFYGINNELVIHAWKGKSLALETLTTPSNPDYQIVEIHGETAYFGTVETGADPHLFLWWEEDGIVYQIYYYQYFFGMIDQEKLIAIAESMQDIDDYRSKGAPPYEYVAIYEQAFGMDVREFPQMPTGWSSVNIWAEPHGRCITMIYMSETKTSWMMINQCQTDKYFKVAEADIPSDQIQTVRIGKHRGKYIVGDLVTGSNGQLVWSSEASVKKLFWQDGDLWIQMTLSGEEVFHYGKDDLINNAESLR